MNFGYSSHTGKLLRTHNLTKVSMSLKDIAGDQKDVGTTLYETGASQTKETTVVYLNLCVVIMTMMYSAECVEAKLSLCSCNWCK